jgi:lysophospholipase L1-like esterase
MRAIFLSLVGSALLCMTLSAQEFETGRLMAVEVEKGSVTIKVQGQDKIFLVAPGTQFRDGAFKEIPARLKDARLTPGALVQFRAKEKGDKTYLLGILLKIDSSRLKPLAELGTGEYQGFKGGLYPESKNERPAAHEAAGLALARAVKPLDAQGQPSPQGKIVLLSVGMSNTMQVSQGFQKALAGAADVNPALLFVNGAVGGMTASAIQNPDDNGRGAKYWREVDERLKKAGATREQVQAVWIKEADAGPTEGFPGYAQKLQGELAKIVQLLPARFPNLKLVYLSGRTYGGYAKTKLNPEPYAYESGFSVKWLIEQQIKGDPALNFDPKKGPVRAPWLSWGPYLWANGPTPRADGFTYEESDYGLDGTHPSRAGVEKIARLMLQFFKSDTTTRPWFERK